MSEFQKEIGRTIEKLDKFKRDFILFLINNEINPDIISQIELSVYEVIINVIDHTTSDSSNEKIKFFCNINPESVICDIQYTGLQFNVKTADLPNIKKHFKEGKNRGLGIYIIHTLMDKVEYSFTDNINKLVITKNI